MGDLMDTKPREDELDLAVDEFEKTLKAFEKAAKNLMAIMESINRKRYQELKSLFGESQQTYEFLIQ